MVGMIFSSHLPEHCNTVCAVAVLAALTQICVLELDRTDFEPSMSGKHQQYSLASSHHKLTEIQNTFPPLSPLPLSLPRLHSTLLSKFCGHFLF